jgi:hypothetical protein
MQGGSRVHGEMIKALELGRTDGSIRKDVGNLMLVSFTLWAFMHGAIQLITTKSGAFPFFGLKPAQLIDQAILMCTRALQEQPE